MSSGQLAMVEGIAAVSDDVSAEQATHGMNLIFLIGSVYPLYLAWLEIENKDANQYHTDVLQSIADPDAKPSFTVKASVDNEQKIIDSAQSDLETGKQNNIIQSQKAVLQADGQAMSRIVTLLDPIVQLNHALASLIMSIPKG